MPNPIGNPNIVEAGKGTRFSKTNRPKNPGRKPSKLKKWIKDYELSKNDVDAVFINFLFDKSIGEIEEIINDKKLRDKLPSGIGFQLQILINQAKKGNGRHLENILYMLFGKPTQGLDITASGNLEVINMTFRERQKRIKELLEETRKKAKNEPEKPNGK
jgi:hypothetical protein